MNEDYLLTVPSLGIIGNLLEQAHFDYCTNMCVKVDLGTGFGHWLVQSADACEEKAITVFGLDFDANVLRRHNFPRNCEFVMANLWNDDALPLKAKMYGVDLIHSRLIPTFSNH
jgi:hypothetical protein